jgi:hypothetical protein
MGGRGENLINATHQILSLQHIKSFPFLSNVSGTYLRVSICIMAHYANTVDNKYLLHLRLLLKAETSAGWCEGVQGLLHRYGGSKVQRGTLPVLCCKTPTVRRRT